VKNRILTSNPVVGEIAVFDSCHGRLDKTEHRDGEIVLRTSPPDSLTRQSAIGPLLPRPMQNALLVWFYCEVNSPPIQRLPRLSPR
jgi:hypothetical protein